MRIGKYRANDEAGFQIVRRKTAMVKYKLIQSNQDEARLAMAGEKDLESLLRCMSPVLSEGDYVFCTVRNSEYGDYSMTQPLASFTEKEGLTLVMLKDQAEQHGLSYEGVFRRITLGVHSSLEAVGLTAAVTGKLSTHGIAANVIAAYFHDHIFVPANLAKPAIGLLLKYND
jgi:hypothetical protein